MHRPVARYDRRPRVCDALRPAVGEDGMAPRLRRIALSW